MNTLFNSGRLLFAVATVLLGGIHLVTSNFPVGLLPVPADFPGRPFLVGAVGVFLVLTGLCLGFNRKSELAAMSLGAFFLLTAFYPHLFRLSTNLYNGSVWTAFGEMLALSGGALYGAGWFSPATPASANPASLPTLGKFLLVALVIFGMLHFQYARYIATLISSWVPAALFWSYFVGVAFVATALSLVVNRQRLLAAGLLGTMFLLWVVVLHGPRTVANPQNEPEWTSLLVALALSGIGFLVAGSEQHKLTVMRLAKPAASFNSP